MTGAPSALKAASPKRLFDQALYVAAEGGGVGPSPRFLSIGRSPAPLEPSSSSG
jgi:hypothetical protein